MTKLRGDAERWLLSFYRASEISGALFFGRLANVIRDPRVQLDLTRHFADESQHARWWTDCMDTLGVRPMKAGMALIFCNDRERAWLSDLPVDERPAALLQLWTAKEALYKADAAQGDSIVAEYGVDVPTLARGGRGAARSTRLISLRTGAALLSVALDLEEDEHDKTSW